jgi:hypothetical protein
MNQNFVNIIKRIIAEQGEALLADPVRFRGLIADYASQESKAERLAFSRCIEYGAYKELKNAADAPARQQAKAALVRKVHANEGLDMALCGGALDALEAALFGFEIPIVQESEPSPINRSYLSKQPVKKHTGRNVFIVMLLLAAIIMWLYYSGNQNALPDNSSAAGTTHTQEQPAPKRDINGLTPADYDENGWAKKDGKWVASPDGARYSAPAVNTELPQVRIVNNTGYLVYYVYAVAVSAQYWGDDKLGNDTLSNGSSVLIHLPSSSTNRYGIRLKDLDGDTYTKWNIPISNNQTITFTIQDIDTE